MKPEPTPSSSFRRSRSLSIRKRAVPRSRSSTSANITVHKAKPEQESRSDNERLKTLLENLEIRFTECTFTFKDSHFDPLPSTSTTKKRSKLSVLSSKIFGSVERVCEALVCEKCYSKCLFVPTADKEKVKDFIRTRFPDIKLTFDDCKFIKRSSTLPEKVVRKLRKFFGISFELEYINSVATINDHTFRMKDILDIHQHIQERIAEEG